VNFEQVEGIANAVLYEGYMLYPYRPSSVKNQQRWNFGVLCPPSYCELQAGSESSFLQTQCLLKANSTTRLTLKIRFLQIVERLICKRRSTESDGNNESGEELETVNRLEVDGRVYEPWQEAVERVVIYENLDPASPALAVKEFSFAEGETCEELRNKQGAVAGVILRRQKALVGSVEIGAQKCGGDAVRLTIRVDNRSEFDAKSADRRFGRDAALVCSLVSAHVVLGADCGEFISLLDPPEGYEEAATQCSNTGVWPVLAGGDASTMLVSPIILYDYPKIAPESVGNLFDGTEIDEILSLRILTLTDEEKAEIRRSDDRARQLLERTECIPDAQFTKLHGALRDMTVLKEVPK
jgi:hypothetical protein